jgi:predicted solute-binding protein
MSKVFENYRNHPSLQHDETALVFKIGDKVYLIGDDTVRQIIPRTVQKTNIGEPYKDLARMCFVFADGTDKSHWCIDFDSSLEDELRALIVI